MCGTDMCQNELWLRPFVCKSPNFGKTTVWVIPTVLEIFYQEQLQNTTVLVIPTVLEIFYQEQLQKTTVLVIPTVLEIFYQKQLQKACATSKRNRLETMNGINTVKSLLAGAARLKVRYTDFLNWSQQHRSIARIAQDRTRHIFWAMEIMPIFF